MSSSPAAARLRQRLWWCGLAAAVDPYDTGRFSVLKQSGISTGSFEPPMRAAANPLFNAALIGNSERPSAGPGQAIGRDLFAFRSTHGTQDRPARAMDHAGWFISHHEKIGAILVVADAPGAHQIRRRRLPICFRSGFTATISITCVTYSVGTRWSYFRASGWRQACTNRSALPTAFRI